ncbi:sensor histidine kinase [Halomicroarcula sp. GCM10025817]
MAARVSLFGLFLSLFPLVHVFRHTQTLLTMAMGILAPAALAALLVAAGPWLYRQEVPASDLARISRWTFACAAVGLGIGVGTVAHVAVLGQPLSEGPFVAVNTGIAGAVGGLLVGYFESRDHQQRRRLEETAGKFRAVFEGTHDALVVADDSGTYVDANPAAATLFGVDRTDLVGLSIKDFAATDFDFDTAWSAFRQEKAGRGQFPLVRADGTRRIVEFAATSDVYPGHHLSALRDVTDRVTYEQELEDQRETLSFLNQVLRHNVLNGIHVVLARADLLETTDDNRDHVEAIRQRGEAIADLVGRVNRLNGTLQRHQPLERVALRELLRTVTNTVETSFPEADVSLSDPCPDVVVDADPMLAEVFENLLTNAIRHNDADTPEVSVAVETADEWVTALVTDNGPGVPDAKKDIVFGRGQKGPASDGTGFGLYIVRALVDRYDGTVELTDNVPRGSVFEVRLPRVGDVPAAAAKRHP